MRTSGVQTRARSGSSAESGPDPYPGGDEFLDILRVDNEPALTEAAPDRTAQLARPPAVPKGFMR